jgi:threonyl-tRNA synthetase
MGRSHQCGTIQLDFQLPLRFNLQYASEDTSKSQVPVMIHRAILGSGERMFAIITENFGGKWPMWLNPRQVAVIPLALAHSSYAQKVLKQLTEAGVRAFMIDDGNTLQKRVRSAQLAQYSYMLVLGDKEEQAETVNIRRRDDRKTEVKGTQEFVEMVVEEIRL